MTKDFTKEKGCYSKELLDSNQLLNAWYADKNVSRDQFVQNILDTIAPAFYNAVALPKFKLQLSRLRTKDAVCTYCYNAILKAMGLGVC